MKWMFKLLTVCIVHTVHIITFYLLLMCISFILYAVAMSCISLQCKCLFSVFLLLVKLNWIEWWFGWLLWADVMLCDCWDSALCVPRGICLDVSGRHSTLRDAHWSVWSRTFSHQMVLRCWLWYAVILFHHFSLYCKFLEYGICRQQGHAGSKTLHQQNPPVLNWRCRLMQVDLYNGRYCWYWCMV